VTVRPATTDDYQAVSSLVSPAGSEGLVSIPGTKPSAVSKQCPHDERHSHTTGH
jgi:hypothetical protein